MNKTPQQEVINFLKKNKEEWYTAKELLSNLESKVNVITLTRNMRSMIKFDEVQHRLRPAECRRSPIEYKYKEGE